jgi:hypothetical protein
MQEQQNREPTDARASEAEKKAGRDQRGRFVVGVSGNPRGKLPTTPEMKAVRELAAVERAANVARLVEIRDNAADVWARIEAVRILVLYSDGKPASVHLGAPLVAMQFNGVGPHGGGMQHGQLSPQDAYRLMCEGLIEPSGDHPAFRQAIEAPVSTVDNAETPEK